MKQMDDNIGYVLNKLEDMGQLDNTIVAFTTDNGAEVITFPDGGVTNSGPESIDFLQRAGLLAQRLDLLRGQLPFRSTECRHFPSRGQRAPADRIGAAKPGATGMPLTQLSYAGPASRGYRGRSGIDVSGDLHLVPTRTQQSSNHSLALELNRP